MATPYNLLSADAQQRLTEFSDSYFASLAMGAPNTWARDFGLLYSSNAIKTIYPLPVSAAGYKLRQGDDKMRALYEKSLSIKPKEYQDGVQELRQIIEAPDFIGWGEEPSRIALETLRFPNLLVASLLNDNPTLEFDGLSLFNDSHPINVLDDGVKDVAGNTTFDNNFASAALNATTVGDVRKYFRRLPGPNGQVMGLMLSHVIVPAALEELFRKFFESDHMYNATLIGGSGTNLISNNIYKGAVTVVVAPELLSDSKVYWIASNGPKPYIVQDGGTPEEITYDESSDFYKNTGMLGRKYVLRMGTAAALPHAIAVQTITG
jgi:phage major head subunit gpT-like protein